MWKTLSRNQKAVTRHNSEAGTKETGGTMSQKTNGMSHPLISEDPRAPEAIAPAAPNDRILLVDDDPAIRETYREILSPWGDTTLLSQAAELLQGSISLASSGVQEGYRLAFADSGKNAIEIVEQALKDQKPFAVAFIDMNMPGIDGAETARQLWRRDPNLKIVIVTAYSEYSPKDIVEAVGREDIFYLRKPFNSDEISQFAKALVHSHALEEDRERLLTKLSNANRRLRELSCHLDDQVKRQAAQLIQADKMASLGVLAAGIAHEINNPAMYITSNLATIKKYHHRVAELIAEYEKMRTGVRDENRQTALEASDAIHTLYRETKLDFILSDLSAVVDESLDGMQKIQNIVKDLKAFSRLDNGQFESGQVNAIIDATLNILRNAIKQPVQIEKRYGQLPEVQCNPSKIGQVFMNLLVNAAQAIEGEGVITIQSQLVQKGRRMHDRYIEVIISDTGKGIPRADLFRVFDPFFTTKPPGKGTGLGLSIAYDIIRSHCGTITADSREGSGSTFTVRLPLDICGATMEGGTEPAGP